MLPLLLAAALVATNFEPLSSIDLPSPHLRVRIDGRSTAQLTWRTLACTEGIEIEAREPRGEWNDIALISSQPAKLTQHLLPFDTQVSFRARPWRNDELPRTTDERVLKLLEQAPGSEQLLSLEQRE